MSIEREYKQEVAKTFNQNDNNIGKKIDVESGAGKSEYLSFDDVLEVFGKNSVSELNNGNSYLESMTSCRGGAGLDYDKIGEYKNGKWVSIGSEFRKISACGKTAVGLRGRSTDLQYFKFIFCYTWMCEKCGSIGGRIQRKRFVRIMKRLVEQLLKTRFHKVDGKIIDLGDGNLDLRQWVFTVPKFLRKYFTEKEDIQALNRMAERIIKKEFPGIPSIRYFHGFGEKERGVYNPHVNIHSFEIEKKKLKISGEQLKNIKKRWALALLGYVREVYKVEIENKELEKVDVHYSFVESDKTYKIRGQDVPGVKLLIHRIEYMARPCPGFEDLEAIKQDDELLKFWSVRMKGFQYITNCGSWKINDCDRELELREDEDLAGEKLRLEYDKQGKPLYITRGAFNLKYKEWDYDELSEGFYRIKGGA